MAAESTETAATVGWAKKTFFTLVLALMVYLSFEPMAWIGLVGIERLKGIRYEPIRDTLVPESRAVIERLVSQDFQCRMPDPVLGWAPKPNGTCELEHLNAVGLRATREFTPVRPPGLTRMTTFGDSFTYGSYVSDEETFQEVLMRTHPGLEVLNFGVAGYGLDQALLRYQYSAAPFEADIVLIGFMTENIYRNVNSFRPFYNIYGPAMGKPRFDLVEGKLVLIPNPLPGVDDYVRLLRDEARELQRIGRSDFYFNTKYHQSSFDFLPSVRMWKLAGDKIREQTSKESIMAGGVYNTESPAFQITIRLFDEFHRLASERGSTPVIAVFPNHSDLNRSRKTYQPLLDFLNRRGYAHIDLMDAFDRSEQRRHPDSLFVHGHYSVAGNRIVAEAIAGYLEANGMLAQPGPYHSAEAPAAAPRPQPPTRSSSTRVPGSTVSTGTGAAPSSRNGAPG